MWRWLSFALPQDLLLSALGTDSEGPERVHALSPLVEQQLKDGGFAEPHLHLGAAFNFPLLWVSTLKALGELSPVELMNAFKSPGAFLGDGAMLGVWLLRAAIARYVLGAFLDHAPRGSNFEWFIREHVESRILEAGGGLSMLMNVRAAIDGLSGASPGERVLDIDRVVPSLQSAYVELTSIRTRRFQKNLDRAWEMDPLASFLPNWSGGRWPEVWLVSSGLRYLESNTGRQDSLFDIVFWQVVRVRCLFYRHIVQRPMTPGLQWFIRFFARLSPVKKPLSKELRLQSALRSSGLHSGLRSLEVRIAPEGPEILKLIEESEKLLLNPVSRDGEGQGAQDRLELGFVIHFQREREKKDRDGRSGAFGRDGHANPSNNTTGYRHAQFYNKRREETLSIRNLLTEQALSLEWIRGLDLCSDEAGVPIWVMAPLMRHVRDAGEVASRILQRRLELEVPACRVAVHAGEDFVHLLTGLRRLDEAIERLGLRPGDRLGHALSLGLDVQGWAKRAGNVVMPVETRLLDLAWEWNWRSRNGGQLTRNRHLLIEREIATLSKRLFEKELSPLDVSHLVEDLHDEECLKRAGFPNGPVPVVKGSSPDDERFRRLIWFLSSEKVFSRGQELLWVEPTQDADALEELQRAVRQKVGARELVVEVNPSSNLLIGHLADIGQHPLWRLRPLVGGDDVPAVPLIIGSDDPITFATELRQEYQLVYDTLVLGGCSAEQAEGWLEGVRRTSLTARFTVPWSRRSVHDLKGSNWSDEQRRGLVDPP
jgi:hypothetical protein